LVGERAERAERAERDVWVLKEKKLSHPVFVGEETVSKNNGQTVNQVPTLKHPPPFHSHEKQPLKARVNGTAIPPWR